MKKIIIALICCTSSVFAKGVEPHDSEICTYQNTDGAHKSIYVEYYMTGHPMAGVYAFKVIIQNERQITALLNPVYDPKTRVLFFSGSDGTGLKYQFQTQPTKSLSLAYDNPLGEPKWKIFKLDCSWVRDK